MAVILNNALVERLSLHTRITAGRPATTLHLGSQLSCLPCHSLPSPCPHSPYLKWAHFLGPLWSSMLENRVRPMVGAPYASMVPVPGRLLCPQVSWAPCCSLSLACSSFPIPLHDHIQFQSLAQMAPPPGSLPSAPLRALKCPGHPPSIKEKKERRHLKPDSPGGLG